MIKSGKRFSLAMSLREQLQQSGFMINTLLHNLDPAQHDALVRLREAVHKKYPYARALDSVDPLLMEGRGIMWNRRTGYHADNTDPPNAWVALLVLGQFTGGHLFIRSLNLRLSYEPGKSYKKITHCSAHYLSYTSGTLILLRGHILPHEVELWVGGQRVSIVHFTHQSLWDEFGMECP
jgi:hypothetical protein